MLREAIMHDGFGQLAIGVVWGITIAGVVGTLVDNAAMAAGVGLALASVIGGLLFTLGDQPASAIPLATPKPILRPKTRLQGRALCSASLTGRGASTGVERKVRISEAEKGGPAPIRRTA
jgi:hypothetical protein